MKPQQRVLISGAGPAGNILAFYLAKYGFQVVVVERSRADQKLGQGIEIEPPAVKVVEMMGVLDTLEKRKTGEAGTAIFDEAGRTFGRLGVNDIGLTGALEMMRGDLTEILYEAADESPNVTYQFEVSIQSMRQTEDRVIVDIENRKTKTTKTEEFDFVVGSDGVKSRTRQLAMGSPEMLKCYHSVNAQVAYFSIPSEERDWPDSRLCHFTKGRVVWIRPVGKDSKFTSVYFIYLGNDDAGLREANASGDRYKQKEAWARIFGDAGWDVPRVLEGMMETSNFYSDDLTQVKLPKWSENRVVLLGDAAWAPTPFTGEGNQLAIIGAWVLAQEMNRNRTTAAFANYEKRFRAYVEQAQAIGVWGYAPRMFAPQTRVGIWCIRAFFITVTVVVRVIGWLNLSSKIPDGHPSFDLEEKEYEKEFLS